jgi:endonuclease/exonuclease/phosphatase family metal-dependent hydrolase
MTSELRNPATLRAEPWLLYGDFNMVYRAEDKSNSRVNRRIMGQFRRFVNDVALKKVHLNGHLFTWSNELPHSTLEHIDRAFISSESEDLFPHHKLHSLSTLCSDHAPLLLQSDTSYLGKRRFHFRAFWPRWTGFLEVLERA